MQMAISGYYLTVCSPVRCTGKRVNSLLYADRLVILITITP